MSKAEAKARMKGRRFFGYLLSGGSAAVIDWGGFLLLMSAGMGLLPAAVASFLVAAVWNYLLSALFVFGHRPTPRQFGTFLLVASVGLAINASVTWLASWWGVPPAFAKLIGIGVAFGVNYAANTIIVFRRPGDGPALRKLME